MIPNEYPTMQPSVKLPNASEAIDIKYSETCGRHLVATRDIKPGEVIIAEESYICFPEENRIHSICSHCMTFVWNGIPCDSCVFVVFCSEKCKNEAWQEYHKLECPIIPYMFHVFDECPIEKAMVPLRAFIKAVVTEGFNNVINEVDISNEQNDNIQKLLYDGVLDSQKFRSYYNLMFHDKGPEYKFHFASLIITLLHKYTNIIPVSKYQDLNLSDMDLLVASVKIIMRLSDIIKCNAIEHQAPFCDCVNTDKCKELCNSKRGTLFAATCSLINHSCCPNVCRMFVPEKKIVMYTTTPVKKGEQLCDSYGPVFSTNKELRQSNLKENFNFICNCQACEEDWSQDIFIELDKNPLEEAPMFNEFKKAFNSCFPDRKFSDEDPLLGFIKQWYPEKSVLEKVIIVSDLVYKYFDYRTAYCHCLRFNMYIDMTFLKFYEDNCIVPNTC